ncbi:hypothetical protein CGRA01v4_15052 [Colletotrichum graminicola]|uniref:Uncharacterized protein n=1 Tax=Colletotrichum graminicola (strain M1.001 / M2 / FGSC 10212) TaxID=645133 RepID=E3R087_COLGM|nr:uncharacterized protein GLRG_11684 [Colletotrichum graminicola M1.001]EFQ36525.1 hypothetical protein GLRG_11684 [Colletotrichum graminicola M1.001]WDK23760.1 hypothetical protein CGRA01v4_15052 [Colletotrichum graminicola]
MRSRSTRRELRPTCSAISKLSIDFRRHSRHQSQLLRSTTATSFATTSPFAAPVPFAQELADRLNQRRQALDRAPVGPPRPPPLPPAPIPAGPAPFAAQLAARLEDIRRRRQLDNESSDVSEPEQELHSRSPPFPSMNDLDDLDRGSDSPPAQSPDYIPLPNDDAFRFSSPSPTSRDPPNDDERNRPDELGLSGSDLEEVAVSLARRRACPRPYASVDIAVDQVSRGAASSTSRRLYRAANFFTPSQRAAATREAGRATRAILERFADGNAVAAAAVEISEGSPMDSGR